MNKQGRANREFPTQVHDSTNLLAQIGLYYFELEHYFFGWCIFIWDL